ncbi:MAG: hypothetical protein IPL83_16095 [Bdellovibrionales bacterium]|nr:hypothetical protein [Bdellovibrionales bacterium]
MLTLILSFWGFEVKTYRVWLIMKKLPSRPLPNSLNKYVSAPTLLNQARKAFEKIPDARRYGQQIFITGCSDVWFSGLWLKISFVVKI